MFLIDKYVGSVSEFDLIDGSVGIMWVKFREGKAWARPVTQYYHEFSDKRGNKLSNCYEFTELEHFNVWLETVYYTCHLHDYLHNKFKKDAVMLAKVDAFKHKILGNGNNSKAA